MLLAFLALGIVLAACGGEGSAKTQVAPNGAVTLLDGKTTTLASLRDGPTLVWFVAAGCASCAASIPAVAQRLAIFARADTRVLAFGLYGSFDQGSKGLKQLAAFGRAAAGPTFSNAVWTWGLASAGLSAAYDRSGVPDEYFLLDAAGRTAYQGSVPVSTMGTLLDHLRSLTGVTLPAGSTVPTSAPVATLP